MVMPEQHIWRFLASELPSAPGDLVVLDEEEQHFARVLRLRVGEYVEATDNLGGLARGRIVESTKKGVQIGLESKTTVAKSLPVVTLFLGNAKPNAVEKSVESAVELGADEIYIVCGAGASRGEWSPSKIKRLERIVREACRVSKRTWGCPIHFDIQDWAQAMEKVHRMGASAYVCDEAPLHGRYFYSSGVSNHRHLIEALAAHDNARPVALMVGSESGFNQDDKETITQMSIQFGQLAEFVSLGKNILTVPNAVAAAMAMTEMCRVRVN